MADRTSHPWCGTKGHHHLPFTKPPVATWGNGCKRKHCHPGPLTLTFILEFICGASGPGDDEESGRKELGAGGGGRDP